MIRHLPEGGIRIRYNGLDGQFSVITEVHFSRRPDSGKDRTGPFSMLCLKPQRKNTWSNTLFIFWMVKRKGNYSRFQRPTNHLERRVKIQANKIIAKDQKLQNDQFNQWITQSQNDSALIAHKYRSWKISLCRRATV